MCHKSGDRKKTFEILGTRDFQNGGMVAGKKFGVGIFSELRESIE
jgi:hypothetical protein